MLAKQRKMRGAKNSGRGNWCLSLQNASHLKIAPSSPRGTAIRCMKPRDAWKFLSSKRLFSDFLGTPWQRAETGQKFLEPLAFLGINCCTDTVTKYTAASFATGSKPLFSMRAQLKDFAECSLDACTLVHTVSPQKLAQGIQTQKQRNKDQESKPS